MLKIILEGPDKTGKDLIKSYIDILSEGRFVVNVRGPLSTIVYNKKYKRDYPTEKYMTLFDKDTLYVLINCDYEDRKIRCQLTHHEDPEFFDVNEFNTWFNVLEGDFNFIKFNSSKKTPYTIAKEIIEYANKI